MCVHACVRVWREIPYGEKNFPFYNTKLIFTVSFDFSLRLQNLHMRVLSAKFRAMLNCNFFPSLFVFADLSMKSLVCKSTATDSEFGSNVELQTVNREVNREVFKITSRCCWYYLIHKHSYIKNQLLKHLGRFQRPRDSLVCSLSENNTSLLPSKLWVCSTSNNANGNKQVIDIALYYHDNDLKWFTPLSLL